MQTQRQQNKLNKLHALTDKTTTLFAITLSQVPPAIPQVASPVIMPWVSLPPAALMVALTRLFLS